MKPKLNLGVQNVAPEDDAPLVAAEELYISIHLVSFNTSIYHGPVPYHQCYKAGGGFDSPNLLKVLALVDRHMHPQRRARNSIHIPVDACTGTRVVGVQPRYM